MNTIKGNEECDLCNNPVETDEGLCFKCHDKVEAEAEDEYNEICWEIDQQTGRR